MFFLSLCCCFRMEMTELVIMVMSAMLLTLAAGSASGLRAALRAAAVVGASVSSVAASPVAGAAAGLAVARCRGMAPVRRNVSSGGGMPRWGVQRPAVARRALGRTRRAAVPAVPAMPAARRRVRPAAPAAERGVPRVAGRLYI